MAGVQALVNQSTGSAQGNPNPVYYSMAVKVPSAFHPITQGDITVNCNGPRNCFGYLGNIDYGRDFSKNVEASFRPAPAIRPLESGEYCLMGPMSTPHIKLQIALEPSEARDVPARLPFGPYRLRTLEAGPECDVDWNTGGFPALILGDDEVAVGPPAPKGMMRLENRGKRARIAIVEIMPFTLDPRLFRL